MRLPFVTAWTVAAATLATFAGPAPAQTVEEFYKGRNVSLVIGFSGGTGYDIYGRTLARFMGKHIPGRPTIVAQNMPGAGSQRAAQFLYSVAPKDGSVFGTMSRSMPVEPLLGDAKFDGRAFSWIGNVADNSNSLCATWHTTNIKTWDDVLSKPFVLGGQGPGSDLDNFAGLLRNLFGAKIKLVSGYPGGSEVNLAIERGEIDGRCGWSWDSIKGTRPQWLKDKKINLLAVFALKKAADVPADVPLVMDKANDEQKQILRVHLAAQALGRPFGAPPGIPADRKAALRKAFDDTMKDPDFVAEAKRLTLEVSPMTGAGIDEVLGQVYALSPELIAKAKAAVKN
jgi:tripartite-type tricarboxylate transporter receptor subunit TctC